MKSKTRLTVLAIVIVLLLSPLVLMEFNSLQNSKTPQAQATPIRVACVGDSITQITGYPQDLQAKLGTNYTVGNFGKTGSTVLLNSSEPYMNQSQFQDALNFEPNITIIMLGTNDDLRGLQPYNGSFEEDYAQLINAFEQLPGNQQIFIAESPPIFSNSSDLSPSYLSNVIIPKTQDVASQFNLSTIDVYDAFGNNSGLVNPDGVHPNSQGAEVIAQQVYDAITNQNDDGISLISPTPTP